MYLPANKQNRRLVPQLAIQIGITGNPGSSGTGTDSAFPRPETHILEMIQLVSSGVGAIQNCNSMF